jgi:hypothetical protein
MASKTLVKKAEPKSKTTPKKSVPSGPSKKPPRAETKQATPKRVGLTSIAKSESSSAKLRKNSALKDPVMEPSAKPRKSSAKTSKLTKTSTASEKPKRTPKKKIVAPEKLEVNDAFVEPMSVIKGIVVTRDDISARAHQIWIDEGCPEGRAIAHWNQAEQELLGEPELSE